MKKLFLLFTFLAGGLALTNDVKAQELVHQFKNPYFGGNTFNYQVMLSSAQVQNGFTDPNAQVDQFGRSLDPLADFQQNLNRQILSQLSRQLVDNIFGAQGELTDGTYEIGSYSIEISSGGDGVNVNIFDILTGGQTSVTVPTF